MEVAIVARGQTWFFDGLGEGSNDNAEWLALCLALEVAHSLAAPVFDLVGDSRSVIDQASGAAPCRSLCARDLRLRYKSAAADCPPRRLRWIPRHQNLAGIALNRRRNSVRRSFDQ
jgi:ribonuclease HI